MFRYVINFSSAVMKHTGACSILHHDYNSLQWRTLRTSSSLTLDVRRTRLSTVGDRAFPVAAAHTWNSLPQHVTFAPSMSVF